VREIDSGHSTPWDCTREVSLSISSATICVSCIVYDAMTVRFHGKATLLKLGVRMRVCVYYVKGVVDAYDSFHIKMLFIIKIIIVMEPR
jgi:hypothetical protein